MVSRRMAWRCVYLNQCTRSLLGYQLGDGNKACDTRALADFSSWVRKDLQALDMISDDANLFSECENAVVEFQSTWNAERECEKAIPIPTQTDPVNASVDKSSNTNELKHISVQTELHFNTAQMPKDVDSKLVGSLKHLSAVMEAELAKGVTQVFTFRPE